jgi:2-haloacid dehalogenase
MTGQESLDFARFEVLTFDCYGTLIDWETGLKTALGAALGIETDDDHLERFARHEASLEAGPYLPYRAVLSAAAAGVGDELGHRPEAPALEAFGGSVAAWPAFPDSAAALASLASRFRLGVITNCDDDLFAASAARLGDPFTWVITAQQAQAYKPSLRPFELAFARIDVPRSRILHVAQSLFHDHVPAKALGLTTVWVDRRAGRPGAGATPPAASTPDLRVTSMAELASLAAG